MIVTNIWQKLSSFERKATLIVTDFWQLLSQIFGETVLVSSYRCGHDSPFLSTMAPSWYSFLWEAHRAGGMSLVKPAATPAFPLLFLVARSLEATGQSEMKLSSLWCGAAGFVHHRSRR